MELIVGKTFEEMSQLALKAVLDLLKIRKEPVVSFPSGKSPVLFLEYMVSHFRESGSIPDWHFVGLDEWVGMDGEDKGSCRYFFDEHLFGPLRIPERQIHYFNGKASDLNAECKKADEFIEENNRLELAVLGIGMNGHLGFNEPGTNPNLRSHVIDLDETTIAIGKKKYFNEEKNLEKGITLGLATLLEARTVILLVNGEQKAPILRKALKDPITIDLPASQLRSHPRYFVYADKAAASEL